MDPAAGRLRDLTRRAFLKGSAAAVGVTALASVSASAPFASAADEQWWLGPDLWANRLQDWCLRSGRITCVALGKQRDLRAVAWLTRALTGGAGRVSARTGTVEPGKGFSGFLIGTGEPGTDYRRAALAHTASGQSGGLLCCYESDGKVRFREHTDETDQLGRSELPATITGPGPARFVGESVDLMLTVATQTGGRVSLTLRAVQATTRALLSQAVLTGVTASRVRGGLSLVSSGAPPSGATHWLSNLASSGAGIVVRPERQFGPIAGVLFSAVGRTLKMTVQVMPSAIRAEDRITLQTRDPVSGSWVRRASAAVGAGYTALLRVADWDSSTARDFRLFYSRGGSYSGSVPAEPAGRELRIVTLSCTKTAHRVLDRPSPSEALVDGEQELGLYTSRNVWFPHERLAAGITAQRPDLLVAMGDQFYENSPSAKDNDPAPELDFLYKYLLWLWSFRDLTRRTPCLVMIDDHDVFQGNFWGSGGAAIEDGASTSTGGYVNDAEWVNVVQRVQCGHNPDPVDPAPVLQGITVYFTTFSYGGVDLVVLEDRKFKSGPLETGPSGQPLPPADQQLLGARQEELLQELAGAGPRPRVVLTQTMFACLETEVDGAPAAIKDSNGWPAAARTRALRAIKAARGVMLSGDTHLAALVRHADGPVQFCGPAGSASYARWFEPAALPAPGSTPYTGDYVDGFGNALRVLAVANPLVTQAEWLGAHGSHDLGDRSLKQEGYGLLRVDLPGRRHILEAWRWDVDPASPGASPLPGWPYVLPFDEV